MILRRVAWLLVVAASTSAQAADTLQLKDGRQLSGRVVEMTEESVVVEVRGAREVAPLADVVSMQLEPSSMKTLAARASSAMPRADDLAAPGGPQQNFVPWDDPEAVMRELSTDWAGSAQELDALMEDQSIGRDAGRLGFQLDPSMLRPPKPKPLTSERLEKMIKRMVTEVALIRQLKPKGPIAAEAVDRAGMIAAVESEAAGELSDQQAERWIQALMVIGLLPTIVQEDAWARTEEQMQLAGLYVPERKTLFVASWLPHDAIETTVAHELVHALQDQHFGIDDYRRGLEDDLQAFTARKAIIEGDAIAAEIDYTLRDEGVTFVDLGNRAALNEVLSDMSRQQHPGLATMPTFLMELQMFPYMQGMAFLQAVRQRGPWAEVDKLYADLPKSTEQIMHPEKYLIDRDDPTPVRFASVAPQLGEEWALIDDDSLGEFAIRTLIRDRLDGTMASWAAAGWDGDRYHCYQRGESERFALVWRSVWDSPRDAEEFVDAYRRLVAVKFQRAVLVEGHADRWTTNQGMVAIDRRGTAVLIAEGIDAGRLDGVLDAAWTDVTGPASPQASSASPAAVPPAARPSE